MTDLLRQAIAQIEKLPSAQQDAIAARFLAELQDAQELSQPRLPGLLSGKLGDAFFEPLPEEELQQWE
jgi:hypothetical protein